MNPETIVSVTEAARIAKVSRAAIYQWLDAGRIREVPTSESRVMVRLGDVFAARPEPGQTVVPKVAQRVATRRASILDLCRKNAWITPREMGRRLGVTWSTVKSDINALLDAGKLQGDPHRGWLVLP